MFASEKVIKDILRTTFILMSANKRVSSKNQTFPSLFWTEKPANTILYVTKSKSSIIWVLTSVFRLARPNFAAKVEIIALTSLPELIRAWTLFPWNWIRYQMEGTRCKSMASELAPVTNVEVAKTATSF